jgi:hypothetical protein
MYSELSASRIASTAAASGHADHFEYENAVENLAGGSGQNISPQLL